LIDKEALKSENTQDKQKHANTVACAFIQACQAELRQSLVRQTNAQFLKAASQKCANYQVKTRLKDFVDVESDDWHNHSREIVKANSHCFNEPALVTAEQGEKKAR